MNQLLNEKYSKFEIIQLLLNFYNKTINWLCVNYKDEKIHEILLLNNGEWSRLQRVDNNKICRAHKYFEKFDEFLKLSSNKDFLFTFIEINNFFDFFFLKDTVEKKLFVYLKDNVIWLCPNDFCRCWFHLYLKNSNGHYTIISRLFLKENFSKFICSKSIERIMKMNLTYILMKCFSQ